MANLSINYKNNTIEMNKKFAASASKFGSAEYNNLQIARRDYPDFKVIIISSRSTKKGSFKGLDYKYMENYILMHDNDDCTIMETYKTFRAKSDKAEEMNADSLSYRKIKEWFLNTFPEIEKFRTDREKLYEEEMKKHDNATTEKSNSVNA